MGTLEQIEAALAQARADREQAAGERAKAGANWRKQDDASLTYDKVRSNWVQADAAWNHASSEIDKLTAALSDYHRTNTLARQRAALEAAVAKTRAERDKADTALAAVARARAEREKKPAVAPASVERRGTANDRRKPSSDRRQSRRERRHLEPQAVKVENTATDWHDAVSQYNKADAEWNRARATLAQFNRVNIKR